MKYGYLVNFEKDDYKDGLKDYTLKDFKKEIKALKEEGYTILSVYNEKKGLYLM